MTLLLQITFLDKNYEAVFNERLINLTFHAKNATHFGRIEIELFEDIPILIFSICFEASLQTVKYGPINVCNWLQHRRVFWALRIFEEFVENNFNQKIFACPLIKGKYVAVEPRPIFNNPIQDYMPKFVRMNSNINMTMIFRVKNGRKLSNLISTKEIF